MAHLHETQLSSELLYDGKIIRVERDTVRLEDGSEATREVVRHPGGVCVLALTDQDEALIVRQFRYPYREVTVEIPAGKLEYGEDPADCAVRELKEEAGAVSRRFESLGSLFPTPAYDKEVIYMYLARDLILTQEQALDEDEFLDVVTVPLKEAVDMVMRNELPDAKTQIALLKTARLLEQEAAAK